MTNIYMDNPHHKGNSSKNMVEIMSCLTQLMTGKKAHIIYMYKYVTMFKFILRACLLRWYYILFLSYWVVLDDEIL